MRNLFALCAVACPVTAFTVYPQFSSRRGSSQFFLMNVQDEGFQTVRRKERKTKSHQGRRPSSVSHVPEVGFTSISAHPFEPFMMMLIGLPGSGKSTFAQQLVRLRPDKYVRINQDELGTRPACLGAAKAALRAGKCPVIDRCNASPKQRHHFLKLAAEMSVAVDVVVLDHVDRKECVQRCRTRTGHPTLTSPKIVSQAMGCMAKEWQLPNNNATREDIRHVMQLKREMQNQGWSEQTTWVETIRRLCDAKETM